MWGVNIRFRCAHVASGNDIVERCHHTVKVIAARKGCSLAEAVYLYNLMPKDDCTISTAPANMLYRHIIRICGEGSNNGGDEANNTYRVGEQVWIRPHEVRCDRQYGRGVITGVVSNQAVEVNGRPRHVRDLRRRSPSIGSQSGSDVTDEDCDGL